MCKDFWWQHPYFSRWDDACEKVTTSAGYFLNKIMQELQALDKLVKDPVEPAHGRCDKCDLFVRKDQHVQHKVEPRCRDSTLVVITSLTEGWSATTACNLDYLQNLSSHPIHVTDANLTHLVDQCRAVKCRLEQDNIQVNIQSLLKGVFIDPNLRNLVMPGLRELALNIITAASSEAIAETYGSVMETYHSGRFFNSGEGNDDERCQREFFCRFNGPKIIYSKSLCQRITRRLMDGVPYICANNNNNIRRFHFPTEAYARAPTAARQVLTSKVIARQRKDGDRFGMMEQF